MYNQDTVASKYVVIYIIIIGLQVLLAYYNHVDDDVFTRDGVLVTQ